MKINIIAVAVVLFATIFSSMGKAETYVFGEKPALVNVVFESKMEVEDIIGSTNLVSGSLDLVNDNQGSFSFEVPVDSLKTGIDMRDEHLRGEYWLDSKKFPKIIYKGESIKKIDDFNYEVLGKLEMKGVSKDLGVKISYKKIPKDVAKASGLDEAEYIKVKGEFSVKLSDFGIKIPDMAAPKVNDEWSIKVSLFGVKK